MEYRPLLVLIAGRKFRVPDEDCESIIQDAFLAFLGTTAHVENPRTWLIAAVCNLCRYYWRVRTRFDQMEGTDNDELPMRVDALAVERLERELIARRVLAALGTRDRLVLRLHYYERLTAAEIADRLGTTAGYAEKLIVKALKRARQLFAIGRGPANRPQHEQLRLAGLTRPGSTCVSVEPPSSRDGQSTATDVGGWTRPDPPLGRAVQERGWEPE